MTKKNQETVEQTIAERRAEIAKRMYVKKMGDGFHVLEISAEEGSPFDAWQGPFKTEHAAELFMSDLLDAYAEGEPNNACRSYEILEEYEEQARILRGVMGRMAYIFRQPSRDEYFGGCPKCGCYSSILNYNRNHWAFCEEHKLRWCIGSNLFSCWREETQAEWDRNAQYLSRFADVDAQKRPEWREKRDAKPKDRGTERKTDDKIPF